MMIEYSSRGDDVIDASAGSYDDVMEMRSFYDSSTDPELIKRCIARL